jgi:magnesium-transporting ATPase (P-type)
LNPAAVEEGRVVYDNIKKVTLFLISCGFGELIAIIGTIVMGYPIKEEFEKIKEGLIKT